MTDDTLRGLLRRLRPTTPRERQEQALSIVYGNLALSSNHRPTREAFRALALGRFRWTDSEFDAWAKDREWF
jgi:hypothetical protein